MTAVLVGVLSGVYHSSTIFATEFLDLFSMFTFSAYALIVTLHRSGVGTVRGLVGAYFALVAGSLAAMLLVRPIGVFVFAAQVIAVLVLEWRIFQGQSAGADRIDYRHLKALLTCFLVALAAWVPDYTRLICVPDDHLLQGHATWHVVNSFCFYFLYRFYRQFDFGGGARRGVSRPGW